MDNFQCKVLMHVDFVQRLALNENDNADTIVNTTVLNGKFWRWMYVSLWTNYNF
jgi:hypothetical protein